MSKASKRRLVLLLTLCVLLVFDLHYYFIDNNAFNGTIPTEIGLLTSLGRFVLSKLL